MGTQIRVVSQDNNIVFLDLEGDQPITANYQFKDIQDFKSNKGDHTYSFRVPSTTTNNTFFNFYFKVTQFGNFDPNRKCEATILKDSISVFNGFIQLTNVIRSEGKVASYECVVYSGVASLGQVLKGKYITEFNWDELDHIKSLNVVTSSWGLNLHGGDVVYSIYDYGQSPMYGGDLDGSISNQEDAFNVNGLFPQVKVAKMLDVILGQSGYTYESDYFTNSASEGYKLYVDANNGGEGTTPVNDDYYHVNVYNDPSNPQVFVNEGYVPIKNAKITGSNYTNDAGLYNPINGDYTIPSPTPFSVVEAGANLTFTTSESTNNNETAPYTDCSVSVALVIGAFGYYSTIAETRPIRLKWQRSKAGTTGRYFQETFDFPSEIFEVTAGAKYQFQFRINGNGFTPSGGRSITLSNSRISFKPTIGFYGNRYATFDASLEVKLKYLFPKIKAVDFLTSLVKKFNLVIIPDKFNPNKLTIEPYVNWIGSGNNVDWTSKLDLSKDVQFKPTSELQAKSLLFTDDESNDNMNNLFRKSSTRNYGSLYIDNSDNDFGKENEEVKTIFKPVITSYIPYTTIPSCICYEGEGSDKTNPEGMRLSFYNGNTFPANGQDTIWLTDGFEGTPASEYSSMPLFSNYSSTGADPFSTCLTFMGENTGQLNVPPIFNTAYNKFWKPFLNETYSRESRLLIGNFNLNAVDINTLQFNDIVEVEGVYYRINKISNYSMVGQSSCQVELIKVEATKVIASDGSLCEVEPYEFEMNKNVKFRNITTGVDETPTQECCEAYGYEWSSTTNTCYGRTTTPVDVTTQAVTTLGTSSWTPGTNATGLFAVDNGMGNTPTDFSIINGTGNEVKPSPKKLIVNGGRNKVSGSVKTANIDGDSNQVNPYELSLKRYDEISTTYKYIAIKQRFRNVKLKGDYGFAIASNSEFESTTQLTTGYQIDNPVVQQVTGQGKFIASASLTGLTSAYIGADGQFDGTISEQINPDETALINEQGNNFIRLPYPSFIKGEVKIIGTPEGTANATEYADETFEFEVNNQGTTLYPSVTISNVATKSNSTPNFNNLDLEIKNGSPSTYYNGSTEEYINDGMFAFKIDQSTMPNMGKVNYNLKAEYSLINSKSRSRIPFNPTTMTSADCVCWLDPNDSTSVTTGTGGVVTTLADKSGFFSNIFFGSAGGNTELPKYTSLPDSNKQVLNFTGAAGNTGDMMLQNSTFDLYRIPYFEDSNMFVVYQAESTTASTQGNNVFNTSYFNGVQNYGISCNATTNGSAGAGSTTFINGGFGTGSWSASLNNVPSNEIQVAIGTHYGSHVGFEDQQGTTAQNNNASSPFANQFGIGGCKSSSTQNVVNPFYGYVCELIIFQGNLNTAEKNQVKEYLLNKWVR